MHRVFAAFLIGLAGAWIWVTVVLQRQIAEDTVFHAVHVAPNLEKTKRQSDALNQALLERKQGKATPLPPLEPLNTGSLNESLQRMNHRNDLSSKRGHIEMGLVASAMAWACALQIQLAMRRRRLSAPDRPAAQNAGKLIADLVDSGRVFVARAPDAPTAPVVEIDGARALVVFHHFAFVASFVGNPTRDHVEVPFTDLLVGLIYRHKGRSILLLRTTKGKVTIGENVRPFQTLVELLLDVIELNRTSPADYHAALSREPRVRTSWYGWLIIVAALAAVAAVLWSVLR